MAYRDRFKELLEKELAIHDSKSHDYASDEDTLSNFKGVGRVLGLPPWKVALILVGIKWQRIGALTREGKRPNNESVRDTLTDMSIYCKICRILYEEGHD